MSRMVYYVVKKINRKIKKILRRVILIVVKLKLSIINKYKIIKSTYFNEL